MQIREFVEAELTVVAVDGARVLGTAKMGTNRPGPGARVSTASFMVATDARRGGVGTALCRYALDWPGSAATPA